MHPVPILKPNIDRERAIKTLRGKEWLKTVRRFDATKLASVVEFFIPYHLFHVTIRDGGKVKLEGTLAFDAVGMGLDAIDLAGAPFDHVPLERIAASPALQHPTALVAETVPDRARRMLFQRFGPSRLREPAPSVSLVVAGLYVPYWIGVYRRGEAADIEVLNAVTGNLEGAKVREIAGDWLTHP